MRAKVRRVALAFACVTALGAIAAAAVQAQSLPPVTPVLPVQPGFTVYTGSATPTATKVTLDGYVATGAVATVWAFQYGTTRRYGQSTPLSTIAAGEGTAQVTVLITGLKPGTSYHYRLVAIPAALHGLKPSIAGHSDKFTTAKLASRRRAKKRSRRKS